MRVRNERLILMFRAGRDCWTAPEGRTTGDRARNRSAPLPYHLSQRGKRLAHQREAATVDRLLHGARVGRHHVCTHATGAFTVHIVYLLADLAGGGIIFCGINSSHDLDS